MTSATTLKFPVAPGSLELAESEVTKLGAQTIPSLIFQSENFRLAEHRKRKTFGDA